MTNRVGSGCPLQATQFGRPTFVGVLGNSLAFGGHLGPTTIRHAAWPARLHDELRTNFGPNTHVVNGAARASYADFAAMCWDELWGKLWLWRGGHGRRASTLPSST